MPPQSTVVLVITLPGAQLFGGTVELEALEELCDELDFDEELLDGVLLLDDLLEELLDFELLTELVDVPEGTEHSFVPPAILPPNVASLQTKVPVIVL